MELFLNLLTLVFIKIKVILPFVRLEDLMIIEEREGQNLDGVEKERNRNKNGEAFKKGEIIVLIDGFSEFP